MNLLGIGPPELALPAMLTVAFWPDQIQAGTEWVVARAIRCVVGP
jgi:hypothetical protein